jgi:hypothetical protein
VTIEPPDTPGRLWAEYFARGSVDSAHASDVVRAALDFSKPFFGRDELEALEFGLVTWADESWFREIFRASATKFSNFSEKNRFWGRSLSVYVLDDAMTAEIVESLRAEPPNFLHQFLHLTFAGGGPWTTVHRKERIWREFVEPRVMNQLLPHLLLREDFMRLVLSALRDDPEGPLARSLEKWPDRFIAAAKQSATGPVWRHFDGFNDWCEFPAPKRLCGRGRTYAPPDLLTRDRLVAVAQAIAGLLPSRPPDLAHATAAELVAQFQAIRSRRYPIAFYAHGNGDESMEREHRLSRFVGHACATGSPEALAEALPKILRGDLYFPPRRGEGPDWRQYTADGWRAEAWRRLVETHWTVRQAIAFAREAVAQSRAEPARSRGQREREAVIELARSYPGHPDVGAFLQECRTAPDLWGMVDELLVDLQFAPANGG